MSNLCNQGYSKKSKSYRQGSLSLYNKPKKVSPPKILLEPLKTKSSPNSNEGASLDYNLKFSKMPLFHALSLNEKYSNFEWKSLAKVIGFDQQLKDDEELEQTPLTKIQSKTPTKFQKKYLISSSSGEDSNLPVIKTEEGLKANKKIKSKNFSIESAGKLDLNELVFSKGTIEDLRVLLKKLKVPKFR
jgi:hypothetical protein